jgi:3-oxoacyl-[acyl-carrier protein] reductase
MIIVTGASKGIGRGLADHFHSLGEQVLGISRHQFEAPFETRHFDVGGSESWLGFGNELKEYGQCPSVLINCAGIASMNLAVMTPATTTAEVVRTNLLGTIYSCQTLAPLMIRKKMGKIINFSSIAVSLGLSGESIYAASKAGVETFSRILAKELSGHNVSVNCISPGPIETGLLRGVSKKQIDSIVSSQVVKKQFEIRDVVNLVETIVAIPSLSISGQTISLGGF